MQEPYTTVEKVYAYLGITAPSESSPEAIAMERTILAMSRYIDNYCNRDIYRTTPEMYIYDGDGSNLIVIKDCVDITSVLIDGDERVNKIVSYPLNKPYKSRISLIDGYRFNCGQGNIRVVAIQGMFKELPADIEFACTVLVAGVYNTQQVQAKVGTTERIGDYSVTYRTDAQTSDYSSLKGILSSYRRIAL